MQLGYMTEVRIEFVQLSPSVQKTLTRARIDDPADTRYCHLSGALAHSATGTTGFVCLFVYLFVCFWIH